MADERQTPRRRFSGKAGAVRLWTPWLAGPLSWAMHQTLTYWLSSWLCGPDVRWVFLAVTAALLIPPAAGMGLGWRAWTRPLADDAPRSNRVRFLAVTGTVICAASLFGIVVETIPVFVLAPCGGIP